MDNKLEHVYHEVNTPDPKYLKVICPICKGIGQAKGYLVGPKGTPGQVGKCYYCGGTGVARKRK